MTRDAIARLVLRAIAVAIAVAGIIDPVMTLSRPAPQRVVVAQLASTSADAVASAIRSGVPGADVVVRPAEHGRLPCAQGESCVVVADGTVAASVPADLGKVSLVRLPLPAGPNVVLQSAVTPALQSVAGAGLVRVALTGVGAAGRRTEVRVTDGAATLGSRVHEWAADGSATIDVPWWPMGGGARALRVAAVPFEGEATALDNAIEVGVTVSAERARVLVFDARPSWASAFARRALEDDARFLVEHRVGLAPSLAAATAGGRLDVLTLDAVSVVVVGGPDSLSASDVTLLNRFVRERGGTLILAPDSAIGGAAAGLLRGRWIEHLEATPSKVGPLQASETLRLSDASLVDVILGATQGDPAIVLSPAGHGRVVVAGAMDAWRYRDVDDGAFDRFWQSLVLESAAASSALRIEMAEPIAAPGTRMRFVARYHRMAETAGTTVTASAACGEEASQSVRLWPEAEPGVYSGVLPAGDAGACSIRVAVDDGPVAEAGLAVTAGPTASVGSVMATLESAAAGTGGVVGDTGAVIQSLAATATAALPTPIHPMRSPWWMSPFVACLGLEWWLRRRAGLR
jgi:hypothetical protein